MSAVTLGLDVGGTFTDVLMIEPSTGALWTTKTPSTPGNPAIGFFAGIDKALGLAARSGRDVEAVFHGSTIATNAILEGKGARTGMLVTAGFKYVLRDRPPPDPPQGTPVCVGEAEATGAATVDLRSSGTRAAGWKRRAGPRRRRLSPGSTTAWSTGGRGGGHRVPALVRQSRARAACRRNRP